jgi:hypothetical protein
MKFFKCCTMVGLVWVQVSNYLLLQKYEHHYAVMWTDFVKLIYLAGHGVACSH